MTVDEWKQLPADEAALVYLRGCFGHSSGRCSACGSMLLKLVSNGQWRRVCAAEWSLKVSPMEPRLMIACDRCGAVRQVYAEAPGVEVIVARGAAL
jgi:hypothetical protein